MSLECDVVWCGVIASCRVVRIVSCEKEEEEGGGGWLGLVVGWWLVGGW